MYVCMYVYVCTVGVSLMYLMNNNWTIIGWCTNNNDNDNDNNNKIHDNDNHHHNHKNKYKTIISTSTSTIIRTHL
jgi:hypothetical protein